MKKNSRKFKLPTRSDDKEGNTMPKQETFQKEQRTKKVDPIAKYLCDYFANDGESYLALDEKERAVAMKGLFKLSGYPVCFKMDVEIADLDDEAKETIKNIRLFQLEHTIRSQREDRNKLLRATTNIVAIDGTTGLPRYFISAFLNNRDAGNVHVYPQNGLDGTYYSAAAHHDFKPREERSEG